MNTFESMFPETPPYKGHWHAIYLEPIVGSGERITVAIAAKGHDSESRVIQAIRSDLLDCLYGDKADNIQNMINLILRSCSDYIQASGDLEDWQQPFDGITCTHPTPALDHNLDGILRQAIQMSASLSTLSLNADRTTEQQSSLINIIRWGDNIASELEIQNSRLLQYLKARVRIGNSDIKTTLSFLSETYAANFELLNPSSLSASVNRVKAKILDLGLLNKSNRIGKPGIYEIILGRPVMTDPTLTDKAIDKVNSNLEYIREIASEEGVSVFDTDNARKAAQRICEQMVA